jgi:hypothetical protein
MGVMVAVHKSSYVLTASVIGLLVLLGALASMGYSRLGDWFAQGETPRLMFSAPADCNLSWKTCTMKSEHLSVSVYPSDNVQAFKPFSFQVRLHGPLADTVQDVTVHFAMVGMDMGVNRFHLQRKADQRWRGKVILPVCTTGRRDWIATVEIETKPPYAVRFPLTID